MRRQEDSGGIVDLPPNTITINRNSIPGDEVDWGVLDNESSRIKLFDNVSTPKSKGNTFSRMLGTKIKSLLTPSGKTTTSSATPISSILGSAPVHPPTPLYLPSTTNSPSSTEAKSDNPADTTLYEVEKILDHKNHYNGFKYEVKWKGYKETTWEPAKNLKHATDAIDNYFDSFDTKKSLTDDFEKTTGLNTDKTTKQTVLRKFVPEPLRVVRRSSRLNPLPTVLEHDTTSDTKHNNINVADKNASDTKTSDIEDKNATSTCAPSPSDSSTVPADSPPGPFQIPVTKDILDHEKQPQANLATKVEPPPDYSGHLMHTEEKIDLNKILMYALSSENGDDLFEAILAKEKSNIEKAPNSQNEMLQCDKREEYIAAEERELTGIIRHGTWEVVVRPKNRTPITCRWCYDIKRNNQNEIILYKARLVVHSFKQVEGIDYNKTFSSTAQMRSFRSVVMLAEAYDLDLKQYDISNAFLNGELKPSQIKTADNQTLFLSSRKYTITFRVRQ